MRGPAPTGAKANRQPARPTRGDHPVCPAWGDCRSGGPNHGAPLRQSGGAPIHGRTPRGVVSGSGRTPREGGSRGCRRARSAYSLSCPPGRGRPAVRHSSTRATRIGGRAGRESVSPRSRCPVMTVVGRIVLVILCSTRNRPAGCPNLALSGCVEVRAPRHLPDARLALCLLGRQAEVGGCADGVQDAGHDGLERAAEMETDSRAGRFGPGPQQSAQPRAVTEGHTAVSTRSRAGWPSRHVRTASRTAGAVSRSSSPARGMRP